ncbi:YchJ family protein [Nocardioides sambongensis]|uniref:YchJ family protein n=1 Tax=Nocardioides sambongensis TaxID=2589074 RepID=UPI001129BEEC|nr:YchJ family metal-binding protein [Nocardioides sambongensis]
MARRATCPCGSGATYRDCCEAFHAHRATPATAEQLMRSRYSAFAVGDHAYLLDTWHPATRPDRIDHDPTTTWTGLEVIATEAGGADDDKGVVEFVAHHRTDLGAGGAVLGRLHETSRFTRRAGRWVYLRGRMHP